jgi:hypothetical protein
MKRSFFVALSLIYVLGNNNILDGMITQKARQVSSKAVRPQPRIYQTKTSQKPLIFFDRLKLYYNQARQRISQFWYGKKYPEIIEHEKTALINDIRDKKNMSKTLQSFDTFLKTKNQKSVNQLLDILVFSNHEIGFLNAKADVLFSKSAVKNKDDINIARKIINWATNDITRFFFLDENIINDDFFLISLLYIDSILDTTLIPVLHDNLNNIKNVPSGAKFLTLIKSKNPTIYNAIMQREQKLKGLFKESVEKSIDELRSRE